MGAKGNNEAMGQIGSGIFVSTSKADKALKMIAEFAKVGLRYERSKSGGVYSYFYVLNAHEDHIKLFLRILNSWCTQ